MNRSGYVEDYEHIHLYRQTVQNAIDGKRGQAFLRELAQEMDAMPKNERRLIAGQLIDDYEECCAIGVICKARGVSVGGIDPDDSHAVADAVGIARCMAAEIEFMNDEMRPDITPEDRWVFMRRWVENQLQAEVEHEPS